MQIKGKRKTCDILGNLDPSALVGICFIFPWSQIMTVTTEISKAFNLSAEEYESAAKVQQEIGMRMLERLHYLNKKPLTILDLGCGSGFFSRELARMFPKARIFGLDLAQAMVQQAKNKQKWLCKWSLVTADMHALPFKDCSFDLIFANQVLHWSQDFISVLRELNRVLQVDGCLMFTTLGPDTFKELKSAWSGINPHAHTNDFVDMHYLGDWLVAEQFLDPVMDMELLTVHYENLNKLLSSLKAQGVKNINPKRNQGLTGKKAWQHFRDNYKSLQTAEGKCPLTYEVVYGHAWKGALRNIKKGTETFIPVSQLLKNKS